MEATVDYSSICVITSITQRLMVASFRKPTRPSLPLKKEFFLKSPRPSLPLKRAPPLTPTLSPSGEREETAPPRRSEPLCSKVGGPSKVFAMLCGMGPPGGEESL